MFKQLACIFFFVSSFLFSKSEIKKDFYNESKYNQNKSSVYDVRDFVAVGDGKTVNTTSIQKAIDECTKTGGTVVISNGVFITGTIYLKDNVHLKIESGATLKGSGNISDYTTDTDIHMYKKDSDLNRCHVFAKVAQNITISGGGNQSIDLKSINKGEQNIKAIHAISSKEKIAWKWVDGHLQLTAPEQNSQPNEIKAVALKI